MGFQKSSRALALSACSPIRSSQREEGFRDSGLVLLRQVQLALVLKTRASVVLTQVLELGGMGLGPVLVLTAAKTPSEQCVSFPGP